MPRVISLTLVRFGSVCFGSPFTFTGELLDANDSLYLRARYYSPALGVFTALDPVENGNRYQYVGADPINRADPSGLQGRGFGGEDDYNAVECNQCWIDFYATQVDPWGVPKSATSMDSLLLAGMRREECLRDHGCPGAADYTETDNTLFIGILEQVVVGAIRRRGTQAAATALGDWVLPFGDIIGIGLLCLGTVETLNDLRKARQRMKESTAQDEIGSIPLERSDLVDYDALDQDQSLPKKFPSQNCSERLRLQLQDEIDNQFCNQPRSCRDLSLDYHEIAVRTLDAYLCLTSREMMKSRCFPNDSSHDSEINMAQEVYQRCLKEISNRGG